MIIFFISSAFPNARYVGFYLFSDPAILVRSPDISRMVLADNFKHFQANNLFLDKKLDPLLGMSPFFAQGEEWKTKRNQLTPIFTASKVKNSNVITLN